MDVNVDDASESRKIQIATSFCCDSFEFNLTVSDDATVAAVVVVVGVLHSDTHLAEFEFENIDDDNE